MRVRWNDIEQIRLIVAQSTTKSEVLGKMGYTPASSWNRKKLREILNTTEIEHRHLRSSTARRDITKEEIFCEHSSVSQPTLKKYFLLEPDTKQRCYICSISTWNNEVLPLHVDHVNGIHNDNRKDNLRLLCPNCHSLTPTYGGKNKR